MSFRHGMRRAGKVKGGGGFPLDTPIGTAIEGGYFGGFISHTADGVATHALIVVPKASGSTLDQLTNGNNISAASSRYDGAANTALLLADAPSGNQQAAVFCAGLEIGGYTDWYLPAIDELGIIYMNLKPSTQSNYTSSGINNYSVPKRTVNYTAGDPAQTTVTLFQVPNSEHIDPIEGGFGAELWSSTFLNSTTFLACSFFSGRINGRPTAGQAYVNTRAIRRVAL